MAAKILGSCGTPTHGTVSPDTQTLARWRQQHKELLYLVLQCEWGMQKLVFQVFRCMQLLYDHPAICFFSGVFSCLS